uniref:Capsid protein n=1 Tax=Samektorquevirus hominid17 TaxID=3160823 RepID=A0AAU7B9F3_9VIRU
MPFHYYRRNFYRRWKRPRKWRRYYKRKRRPYRWPRRRRARKVVRRTRYGRHKPTTRVRRKKKQFLKLVQWQPEFIRKCKIIGNENLISFGYGRQAYNFTQHVNDVVPNNYAWGGGFFVSVYTLGYLYECLLHYRNIWTTSNDGFDLARYLGAKLIFYRHDICDYVVIYNTSPPMTINKLSYPSCHPSRIMLQRKKIWVPSLKTRPHGKPYIKKFIRPPKLLTNRWFFQEELSKVNLMMLMGTAISTTSPYLSNNTDNNCVGINILNTEIFTNVGWAATTYNTKFPIYAYYPKEKKMKWIHDLAYNSDSIFWPLYLNGTYNTYKHKTNGEKKDYTSIDDPTTNFQPISITRLLRYQPNRDTGQDTIAWLESNLSDNLEVPRIEAYKIDSLPMWLLLFGFVDYMAKLHPRDDLYNNFTLILHSKFPLGFNFTFDVNSPIIPLSQDFMKGKGEWGSPVDMSLGKYWVPCIKTQLSVINDIVSCGPYIARPTGKGFDFNMKYKFFFKWGGNIVTQKNILDPSKQKTYPIPRDFLSQIQIKDPEGRAIQTQFHKWDYRRGMLTAKAIKRAMQDTDVTDSSSTDGEEHPRKRKRTGEPEICHQESSTLLQALQPSEEDIYPQETQETDLQLLELNQQQRLQQQLLKQILKLKKKQRYITLLTGQIE